MRDSALVDRIAPSPNHGERRGRGEPDSIVLHYTGMADGGSALARLCAPTSEVSCHYLVEEDGHVVQLVSEARRAWHAGRSCWRGETDMNSASVGIEIVNGGHAFGLPPFPGAQVAAVAALCRDIAARHAIVPWRVLGHSDISPGRKEDPGERFPWRALHALGAGHWAEVGVGRASWPDARSDLARYGYEVGAPRDERALANAVRAFQRHFRPRRVDGLMDEESMDTLRALTEAVPRDALASRPTAATRARGSGRDPA